MATSVKAPKPARRTQAERSASTRQALLDAAIQCVFEHGYGATTTLLVAKIAGISRGAMLHQFPTKNDLMTFVVDAVFEQEMRLYEEMLLGIDDPAERLIAYPAAAWRILSRPSSIAVQEILQGSRSDAALVTRLKAVQSKVEEAARERLLTEFTQPVPGDLFRLIVGAARGLSIGQVIARDGHDGAAAIEMLQTLVRIGLDHEAFTATGHSRSVRA